MALLGVGGARKEADVAVLLQAAKSTPSVVLDCANAADIHRLYKLAPEADYENIHVQELELLYKYRDCLLVLLEGHNYRCIGVTSSEYLFHYGDVNENAEVYAHSWELLARLALDTEVFVSVPSERQRRHALRHGARLVSAEELMGHTVSSQRRVAQEMFETLQRYSRTLPEDERNRVEKLLRAPYARMGSISYANSIDAWAFLLLSMLERHEARIARLEDELATRRVSLEIIWKANYTHKTGLRR